MSFQNSKKTISNYSYLVGDKIGDGCSSEVYRGIDEKTNEPVSIKVVPKLNHKRNEQLEMARAEIKALQMLKDSENILSLKQVLETKNSIYIITELCEKGTLREVLSQERKLPQARAINILQQIIQGYKAIHDRDLIHRDIKPDNIFLGADDSVHIGDFGFAIDAGQCIGPCTENIGSPLYMPYESLTGNVYSFASDIWAIGMTFLEMLIGKTPWKSKTEKELTCQLEAFKVDNVIGSQITEISSNFLNRVLLKEPSERMLPAELFSFSFSTPSLLPAKQSLLQPPSFSIPKVRVTFALPDAGQMASQKQGIKGPSLWGSEPSTQQHSVSKEKSKRGKESHMLMEPKNKVSSSTLVTSPRIKETIDKKIGGSLIGIQESCKKSLDPLKYKEEGRQREEVSRKLSTTLMGKSDIHSDRLTSKIEKQILSEVQSQINYFRFLFKLAKKMNETLKTNDEHIKALKQHLLWLTHLKITEIKTLEKLAFTARIMEEFRVTQEYSNLDKVLMQYEERYAKEEDHMGLCPAAADNGIAALVSYCLKVLYQNIQRSEGNSDQLHRKKGLIFIAEDLLQLKRLRSLEGEGWKPFHQDSGIAKLLQRTHSEARIKESWEALKPLIRHSVTL